MLSELQISEFALIKDVTVPFNKGFIAITGETGAGKSIIISALSFVLGGLASREMVRDGADKAVVKATFKFSGDESVLSFLADSGITLLPDNTMIIVRELFTNGRTRASVNGKPITISSLQQFRVSTFDLMSQFEQISLLDSANQLQYLDLYGGLQLKTLVFDFLALLNKWRACRESRIRLEQEITQAKSLRDLYDFQIMELASAKLDMIDEQSLLDESRRMQYAEKINGAAQKALNCLADEQSFSASSLLNDALAALTEKPFIAEEFCDAIDSISIAMDAVNDCVNAIRDNSENVICDDDRLNLIEKELHQLAGLKKKYANYLEKENLIQDGAATTAADLAAYYQFLLKKIDTIECGSEELESLRHEETEAADNAISAASELSKLRLETAIRFERAITSNLEKLNLKKTKIKIDLQCPPEPVVGDLSDTGFDRANIFVSLNPGESLMTLAKVASGGELSRILLAVKTALSEVDKMPSIVFDEIDAGIGGETARCVGSMLKELSARHQLLCITHLPQIAAYADHHLRINKSLVDKRNITDVISITGSERIEEVARMLSGQSDSNISLVHAEELVRKAQGF